LSFQSGLRFYLLFLRNLLERNLLSL
jgi:hypothetical protein